jgi:hypothetical protein
MILHKQLQVSHSVAFGFRRPHDILVAPRPKVRECYGTFHRSLNVTDTYNHCNEIWGSKQRR